MACHQAPGRATETTVGQKRDFIPQSFTDDGSSYSQHLAHSRSALRSFISNNDYIRRLDLFVGDRMHGILLAFENPRRATMIRPLMPSYFDDTALRGKIAFQNHESSRRFNWVTGRIDHFLSRRFINQLAFLRNCQSTYGHLAAIDVPAFDQSPGDQPYPAGPPQIDRRVSTARLKVRDQGSTSTNLIEVIDRQWDIRLARHGEKMENRIGRTASYGNPDNRVFKCLARYYFGRQRSPPQ